MSNKIIVGLDMSLTSAGIAIFYQATKKWQLYAFAQRKREIGLTKKINTNCTLTLFNEIPSAADACDAFRYKFVIDHIIKVIPLHSIVLIEAYAYPNKAIAGSNFKLHELGGVLKVELLKKNITDVSSIVNTSWKKLTLGNGNATKLDVVNHCQINEPNINILEVLNLQLTKNNEVPCPAQDIADAICIVKSYEKFILKKDKNKTKEPKQKKIKLSTFEEI